MKQQKSFDEYEWAVFHFSFFCKITRKRLWEWSADCMRKTFVCLLVCLHVGRSAMKLLNIKPRFISFFQLLNKMRGPEFLRVFASLRSKFSSMLSLNLTVIFYFMWDITCKIIHPVTSNKIWRYWFIKNKESEKETELLLAKEETDVHEGSSGGCDRFIRDNAICVFR